MISELFSSRLVRPMAVASLGFLIAAASVFAQSDYQLRTRDNLNISVAGQPDLTKKYTIDDAGNLEMPLIGRVHAEGLTTSGLGDDLRRRLGVYLTDPQVTVDVERTRRVFVFGGVTSPGMYQLTDNMTLIELLARAGYGGAAEALIIRARGAADPVQPTDPSDPSDDRSVIRVNLREFEKDLESGKLSRNVVLQEGDTVFVPRFDPNRIYVSGEVRTAGAYSVPSGTTILQAITLAGGSTQDAALGRVKILRLVDGHQKQVDAKLEDKVQPGDTVLVPRRLF